MVDIIIDAGPCDLIDHDESLDKIPDLVIAVMSPFGLSGSVSQHTRVRVHVAGRKRNHGSASPAVNLCSSWRSRLRMGPDEQWLALSIASDEQWSALKSVLGQPAWAEDPLLDTHEGRWSAHDLIDRNLERWACGKDCVEAVAVLSASGIPASPLYDARLSPEHPQMIARGYFERLDHPIVGEHQVPTIPFHSQCRSVVSVCSANRRRTQRGRLERSARLGRHSDREAHRRERDRHLLDEYRTTVRLTVLGEIVCSGRKTNAFTGRRRCLPGSQSMRHDVPTLMTT